MAGRPRKPLALKAREGDTRKIGEHQFRKEMASAYLTKRGWPPEPKEFAPSELAAALREIPEAIRQHEATEKRKARAHEHWQYLCAELDSEQLLCPLDGGVLAGMAWCYALRTEAAELGAVREFEGLDSRYLQASNAVGLNESARAKICAGRPNSATESDGVLNGAFQPAAARREELQ